jgi:Kef-type K+ transport system membrane component KefB
MLEDGVLQVGLVVLVALLSHVLLGRLHVPVLLGLLLAGLLLGPAGAGIVPTEPVVEPLGEIGLLFVMFIAGLEIDLDAVNRHRRDTLLLGALSVVCTGLPAAAVGLLLLGMDLPAAALLGALISSHTLLALPLLQRLGLVRRLPVVAVIGGTLVTDTLALLVLAVVLGPDLLPDDVPFGWAVPLVLLGVLAVVAMTVLPRLAGKFLERERGTRVDRAMFAVVVLLGMAAAAELIGTEPILGAFLAGIALNRALARREVLREHVEFLGRVLLVPFFFFWTGTLLELDVVLDWPGVWPLAGLLLLLVLAGKTAAAWATGAVAGYDGRWRVLMASLTVPQAAATLAVAITGAQAGVLEDDIVDAVVLVILVTCVLGPLVTQATGRRLAAEEPASDQDDEDEPVDPAGGPAAAEPRDRPSGDATAVPVDPD